VDHWLVVAGLGAILGGVNFITTILGMRAAGMTMFRMQIFTWNIFITRCWSGIAQSSRDNSCEEVLDAVLMSSLMGRTWSWQPQGVG
jgi:hypothetical protein